ncbi:MAG: GDP-mannose 4,6-dehydratase [Candidatus Magnetoovum sp. WYHC-5]|nr:GDP-mannose 4,6-dehydratase [Candidatus Magnetoovum sp. WYHC-5]
MKITNLKVLVTGGAGFIGSHLVDKLLETNNKVTVLDNYTSGKRENLSHCLDKIQLVEGDVCDKSLVYSITRDIDVIFHLAVQCLRVSINNPEINHEVNATGTLNLCLAAIKNWVRRFVYISSSEVYGSAKYAPMNEVHPLLPTTIYGASKAAGELYTLSSYKTYNLESMVVRPFNTYGPRSHFEGAYGEVIPKFTLRLLNDKEPIIFGNGKQTRDFTYVSDTVAGIFMAAQCDELIGDVVNIAKASEVSINALLDIIKKALSKEHIDAVYDESRPGDVIRHVADITKAKRLFRYTPKISIEEGINKYIEWFTSQGYDYKELFKKDITHNWQ